MVLIPFKLCRIMKGANMKKHLDLDSGSGTNHAVNNWDPRVNEIKFEMTFRPQNKKRMGTL